MILLAISAFLVFAQCKPDTTLNTSTDPSAADMQDQSGSNSAASQPATTPEGHDYTFLTHQLFLYSGSMGPGGAGEDAYKDQWIDLLPDGTFKAGKLKAETHTGKWSYNHDQSVLLLQPSDPEFPTSEWKVMHNEQMMVWVGTTTYGNQSTQVRLLRSEQLP